MTVYEYQRDVQRLIELVRRAPSQYHASLSPDRYPILPTIRTPLGDLTLRVLGYDSAIAEGTLTIFRVEYEAFVHLIRADGEWKRLDAIIGLRRLSLLKGSSYVSDYDLRPARARFDKVALPMLASHLDAPQHCDVRSAAQAARLLFEVAEHEENLKKLEAMIATLADERTNHKTRIADANAEIDQLHALLQEANVAA